MASVTQGASAQTSQTPKKGVPVPDIEKTFGKPREGAGQDRHARLAGFYVDTRCLNEGCNPFMVLRGDYGVYSIETIEGFVFRKKTKGETYVYASHSEIARFKADIAEAARSNLLVIEYVKKHPHLRG